MKAYPLSNELESSGLQVMKRSVVCIAEPERFQSESNADHFLSLLDDQELSKYRRFKFAQDAHLYLVSHAMLRLALTACCDVPPESWRFRSEQNGRPVVDSPEDYSHVHFSLSHSRGLAACIVSVDRVVGIDVERIQRQADFLAIAERNFAEQELQDLRQSADPARTFLRLWTLKEALLKAIGLGLSVPLRDCAFRWEEGPIRVEFDGTMRAEDQEDWVFASLEKEHIISIAVQKSNQFDCASADGCHIFDQSVQIEGSFTRTDLNDWEVWVESPEQAIPCFCLKPQLSV